MNMERENALRLCNSYKHGYPYVAYDSGAWHCFNRRTDYPYRVRYSILVGVNDE